MKYLTLILMLLAPIAVTQAREAASVRLGDHGSFVRFVLETPSKVGTEVALGADGLSATVTAAAELDIALPTHMAGVVAAIDKAPAEANKSGLILHFKAPVKIASRSVLPPEASAGQRVVVDFQPLAAETPSAPPPQAKPAQPAPPPAPAQPKTASFILTGFRSAAFGASIDQVLAAIEKDFGAAGRAAVIQSGPVAERVLALTPPAMLPNTAPATIAYHVEPQPRGLARVTVDWNGADGTGLTPEEVALVTEPMTKFFKSIDFLGGHIVLGLVMPDGRLVVFEGIDAAGNVVQMTVLPPKPESSGDSKRQRIELIYAASPTPPAK